VKDLKDVEVIADDFLVIGISDTADEALANHNNNLQLLLSGTRERGLKLNSDKVKLRCSSVLFIGHILIDKGIATDPEKTAAIISMPTPTYQCKIPGKICRDGLISL